MNILVLNYEFPPIGGGAAPVAFDISQLLVEQGNKVTVVTMKYKGTKTDEIVKGIKIHRVPCIRKKANVCHPWEQLSYILSSCIYLRKHLKSNHYDVCHTHFIVPTGVVALYLKKRFKLNYILTSHGSDVIGHNNNRFKLLYSLIKIPWRWIVKNAKVVISPSNYLVDKMKATENKATYRIIPNGIYLEDYRILKKKKSILVSCRLQETKGVQDVIQAFAKSCQGEWILNIAGDGPFRNKLEKLAEKLGMKDHVKFHGWIERKSEQYLELLGEAALYVSASWFESFGLSVLEAMASGCRVLVSDIPAHRQLVQQECYIFKESELQQKLEAEMKKDVTAVNYNIQKYDWKNIIMEYEKMLNYCKQER